MFRWRASRSSISGIYISVAAAQPSQKVTSGGLALTGAQFAQAFQNVSRLLKPGGYFLWSDNFVRQETIRVAHQASRPLAESEANVRAAGLEAVERVPMFVIMNYPADTKGRWPKWLWTALVAPAMVAEPLGWLLGAVLYPVEWLLDRVVKESPSVELMVVRKAGGRG